MPKQGPAVGCCGREKQNKNSASNVSISVPGLRHPDADGRAQVRAEPRGAHLCCAAALHGYRADLPFPLENLGQALSSPQGCAVCPSLFLFSFFGSEYSRNGSSSPRSGLFFVAKSLCRLGLCCNDVRVEMSLGV